ncbi:unnamed protein product, partial [Ectocarpus fasciculatus]
GSTARRAASAWRLRELTRTFNVGIILCLNFGTDPPDVVRTPPCAVKQCWIDPKTCAGMSARETAEVIGRALQRQYDTLQPNKPAGSRQAAGGSRQTAKYQRAEDPSIEAVREVCELTRASARNERALIHYNGHGVPRPTANGEIWVFNRSITQYIPLSIHDLKDWAGKPSIFVLDCSAAGVLLPHFVEPMTPVPPQDEDGDQEDGDERDGAGASSGQQQHPRQRLSSGGGGSVAPSPASSNGGRAPPSVASSPAGSGGTFTGSGGRGRPLKDVIVMAACGEDEVLPTNADLPADVFTCCLTTPMPMALRWFIRQNKDLSMSGVDPEWVDKIPGSLGNRLTPLGELEWIFTAIMDAIAWSTLPLPLFQKLFRGDLLVAKLFRNFLLADRILRNLNCTPVTHPAMPMTCHHPLWQSWDLVAEQQLGRLFSSTRMGPSKGLGKPGKASKASKSKTPQDLVADRQDDFFQARLRSFQVWLQFAAPARGEVAPKPLEELPVVLQILLSQVDRLRALKLLKQYVELGHWAVDSSLLVGIFPYVMKLIVHHQLAPSAELRHTLAAIWARILSFDLSCQASVELVKHRAYVNFIKHLRWDDMPAQQRVFAAFVLACIMDGYRPGQEACLQHLLHNICWSLLNTDTDSDTEVL